MVAALMLRAPSEIIVKVKGEIERISYTYSQLASELGIAVQLVENFFNGEIVDRNTYDLICEKLNISTTPLPKNLESSNTGNLEIDPNNIQSISRNTIVNFFDLSEDVSSLEVVQNLSDNIIISPIEKTTTAITTVVPPMAKPAPKPHKAIPALRTTVPNTKIGNARQR